MKSWVKGTAQEERGLELPKKMQKTDCQAVSFSIIQTEKSKAAGEPSHSHIHFWHFDPIV